VLLSKEEKELMDKLGFGIDEESGRIVELNKMAHADDLNYAGFNTFISKDNRVFEKIGEELVELESTELEAERRFITKNARQNAS